MARIQCTAYGTSQWPWFTRETNFECSIKEAIYKSYEYMLHEIDENNIRSQIKIIRFDVEIDNG